MPRPNVLIFCVDQMRADHMSPAGNTIVRTPNLARLAARGTHFPLARCNNPVCMPARATMFTGLLPRDHGVRTNGQALRMDLPTLPGTLSEAGYRTHSAGKLHLSPWVPKVSPPDVARYPECKDYWEQGHIRKFPTPYYGFQTVDFVGGHTSFAFGEHMNWLKGQGVDPAMLRPELALRPPSGAPQCYHMSLPAELHYNRYIADSTIRLIEESSRDPGRPFFAWCSFPDPHSPLGVPAPYCTMYDPGDIPLPVTRPGELDTLPPVYRYALENKVKPDGTVYRPTPPEHWQEMIALTYGMVTHIDDEMGRVLDALDRAGQADNTIVMFISDHGDMMGDHGLMWKGFYSFNGTNRLPLIVAAPGMAGGRVSEALVCQIDLMPTVLDLCGVAMPGDGWRDVPTPFQRGALMPVDTYPGRSWRGLLDGSATAIHETVVVENDDLPTGYRVRTLVTPAHRLTIYPGTGDGELFDVRNDPDELHNLWYDPAHAGLRAELIQRLLEDYSRQSPLVSDPALEQLS